MSTTPKLFMDAAKDVAGASIHITERLPKSAVKYVVVPYETRLENGSDTIISGKTLIVFKNAAGDLGIAF